MDYYGLEKGRYETKRIHNELPLEYRVFLWKLIAQLQNNKEISLDYLQIFEFSSHLGEDGHIQKITHRQEKPEYKAVYEISLEGTSLEKSSIQGKVYCIDEAEYCIMLWAEEH
ncbi:DUF960 family protein [Anaerosporobacter sp.]